MTPPKTLAFICTTALFLFACDTPQTTHAPPTQNLNVVQQEMQILTESMQEILTHIANAELTKIPTEFAKIQPAYERTQTALEQGTYNPPTDSQNIPEFASRADAFHEDLFTLLTAARANDLTATTTAYTKLIQACTTCHTQFRFPHPTP